MIIVGIGKPQSKAGCAVEGAVRRVTPKRSMRLVKPEGGEIAPVNV